MFPKAAAVPLVIVLFKSKSIDEKPGASRILKLIPRLSVKQYCTENRIAIGARLKKECSTFSLFENIAPKDVAGPNPKWKLRGCRTP